MPSTATLTLLTLALACVALADVRYVSPFGDDSNTPCNDPSNACKTMSVAHTAANDGDSINVAGGTYTGAINLIKVTKSVTIVAASGTTPLNCVFDGQQQNTPGFSVSGNVTVKFVGIGFRGFAEYCSYQDCVVGAVDISDGESVLYVQSCLFFSNTNAITARAGTLYLQDTLIQDSANAGLLISSSQSSLNYIRISNVTIVRGNQGVVIAKSNVQFKATSLFIHNMINAISAQSSYVSNFDVNVASSEFNNNTESAFYFPGVSGSVTAAYVTISNTQFRFNGGQQNNGGALFIGSNTALAMQNSNLIGNIVTNRGGAIFCDNLATINLMNVDVSDNQANDGAAGWCSPQCAFVATSSTSYNNKETQNTGPCAGI